MERLGREKRQLEEQKRQLEERLAGSDAVVMEMQRSVPLHTIHRRPALFWPPLFVPIVMVLQQYAHRFVVLLWQARMRPLACRCSGAYPVVSNCYATVILGVIKVVVVGQGDSSAAVDARSGRPPLAREEDA